MLRLLTAVSKVEVNDTMLVAYQPTFKKDFGPWKKGTRVHKLIQHFDKDVMEEYNDKDEMIKKSEIRLITGGDHIEAIVKWMDSDKDFEHLYTQDGRKVFRFYEGTLIDRYLRELYEEVKPI